MQISQIRNIIIYVVNKIVNKEYDTIIEEDIAPTKKINKDELIASMEQIGNVNLSMPPNDYFNSFTIYVYNDIEVIVEIDLWADGKASDLTLKLLIKEINGQLKYSIYDLLVM